MTGRNCVRQTEKNLIGSSLFFVYVVLFCHTVNALKTMHDLNLDGERKWVF